MIPSVRQHYNQQFSQARYEAFLQDLKSVFPGNPAFRIAETPVFVPDHFTRQLKTAGEQIIDVITRPDFKKLTGKAIPEKRRIPSEDAHTHFIALDFAVCEDEEKGLFPQLIELQGFPTMFAFQALLAEKYRAHFDIPEDLHNYLNGYTQSSYFDLLRKMIVGQHDPREVILLEVNPHEQKTRIDFYGTEAATGIRTVCISELIREDKQLFYYRDGEKTRIRRIYNRVIFDDLKSQAAAFSSEKIPDLTSDIEVEWVPHPNWFYRISKYMLPLIDSPYVPPAYYLSKLQVIPQNLEDYVMKPLYSFAGKGVLIDVTREDIESVPDPENWILQKKVAYAPAISTPNVPAKCEIRLFYFWPEKDERPTLVHNLCRLSKGKMIGVSYNTEEDWVGGSICFFEEKDQ